MAQTQQQIEAQARLDANALKRQQAAAPVPMTPIEILDKRRLTQISPNSGTSVGTVTTPNAPANPTIPAPTVPSATSTGTGGQNYNITNGAVPSASNAVTAPQVNPDGSPGIVTLNELSSDMQTYLNDPKNSLAKSQFDLVATQGQQAIDKFLMDAEKAVVEYKKQKDYTEGQNANQQQQVSITQAQNIRNAKDSLSKADANTYYSAVSPISSGSQQTAAHGQLREMATKVDEMVQLYGLQNDAFAKQTAENARRIQLDLDTKLGEVLSEKLRNIDNGVKNGDIATPEQLDRIFKENSAAILKEVPQLTNFAVQQMSDLTNNFMNTQKELRQNKLTFEAGANKYNAEMSQVQGFAVDGNGNPILDMSGKQIVVPKDAPIAPQFDEKTGQLITFSTNANGTIVGTASQVQGYKPPAQESKRNVIMVDGKPYDVDQERFLRTDEVSTGGGSTPFTPPTTFSSRAAGQSFQVDNTGDGIQISAPVNTLLGQCGAFANDYGRNIPGYKPVTNSWASKIANDNSDEPVAGGLFMYNPSQSPTEKYGHIGVVEKVNPEGYPTGSFIAYDSNIKGDEKSNRRVIQPGSKEYNLINSDGGFFDPTKVGGQKQASTQLPELNTKQQSRVDKYALDFENEPIVKSFNTVMVQVDAFKNYMQDNSGSSDQAMVYAFAKIMDPESVVREGEYETVKKYSQGLLQKYKGEIEQAATGEGFLSETAKKAMLKTLEEGKLKSLRGSYDNIREQKIKQINQIVGGDYGDKYLSEYDYGSTSNSGGQNMSTGGTGKPGSFDLDA